jgi:hypothetical protein
MGLFNRLNKPLLRITNNFIQMKRKMRELYADEREYARIRNAILKFGSEKIYALQRKYFKNSSKAISLKNSQGFNSSMDRLINEYINDVIPFLKKYAEIFRVLKEIVKLDEQEEYATLQGVSRILNPILSRNKSLPVPPQSAADYDREIWLFINEVSSYVKKDWYDDNKLAVGAQPVVGFFTKHRKDKKLVKGMIKLDNKLMKKYPQVESVKERLIREAESGNIEQDFLILFINYLKSEGKFEIMLESIRTEVKELIKKHIDEHNKVAMVGAQFKRLTENYGAWKKIPPDVLQSLREATNTYGAMHDSLKQVEDYVNFDKGSQVSLQKAIVADDSMLKGFGGLIHRGQEIFRQAA